MADEGYERHLWFGPRFRAHMRPETRKLFHELRLDHTPWIDVYPNAIPDEMAVLELGIHVEMEMWHQREWSDTADEFAQHLKGMLEDRADGYR